MNVKLPWPPKELSPNAKRRKHWSAYRGKTMQYRSDCYFTTIAQLGVPKPKGLTVQSITFYPPDHRRRDDDGMIGAFKAGRDGVADALGTDDHKFRPAYHFAPPVPNGRVVVVLEAA
jgi:crossover junction endodeoxyribonuclease RusA